MRRHLNIKVFGQVQGVFFRHSARQKAEELGVKGFARNEPDDTVYIEAEGEEKDLKIFMDWCRQGSDSASVDKLKTKESEIKNFKDFRIE